MAEFLFSSYIFLEKFPFKLYIFLVKSAAVVAYVKDRNLKNVRRVQERLLLDYEQDFSKYAPKEVIPRIQMVWDEFKGALTEQYVCQQILADLEAIPYYWSAEASSGEVDFVLQHSGMIVPIEMKAEVNLNAKSLKNFVAANGLSFGIRTSDKTANVTEKAACNGCFF